MSPGRLCRGGAPFDAVDVDYPQSLVVRESPGERPRSPLVRELCHDVLRHVARAGGACVNVRDGARQARQYRIVTADPQKARDAFRKRPGHPRCAKRGQHPAVTEKERSVNQHLCPGYALDGRPGVEIIVAPASTRQTVRACPYRASWR